MKKSADRKSLFLGWGGPEYDYRANCRMKTVLKIQTQTSCRFLSSGFMVSKIPLVLTCFKKATIKCKAFRPFIFSSVFSGCVSSN